MIFTKDATNEYQGSGFFISEDGLAIIMFSKELT